MKFILFWPTVPGHRAWNVFDIPSDPPLKKINFPSRYQFQITSWCSLPLLRNGILFGVNLCEFYMCCLSLCEFMCFSSVLSRKCFLGVIHYF